MSTPQTPAVPATSKLQNILGIINLSLQGLQLVPVVGSAAGVADLFLGILQNALAAHQAETGQPFDITKIPLEALVPDPPGVVTPVGPQPASTS